MMNSNYSKFSQDDFLQDDFFCSWVKYNMPEAEKFWQEWESSGPPNLSAWKAAREELTLILGAERLLPVEGEEEDVWSRIEAHLDSPAKTEQLMSWLRRNVVAAALVTLLLLSAGWFFLIYNPDVSVQTSFGQLESVTMPDASVVKLNANSKITYLSRWDDGSPREVFLQGEAFFNVKHVEANNGAKRFIVYTDRISVEVTGTTFNVKERRNTTEVSLETGTVVVRLRKDTATSIMLQPGDLVFYDHQTGELKKKTEDPAYHLDWTDQKILTNNTPVSTILQELEDIYGYEVVLEDTAIGSRKIDGVLPIRNEANTLFILSNMLNVDIQKQGNRLIIKNR